MIGGIVTEVLHLEDRIYVNCMDDTYSKRSPDECAIYIENTVQSQQIKVGDAVWWQMDKAIWTPKNKVVQDVQLKKIGYSGIDRPIPKPVNKFLY